eukprot:TRINITY_DN43002_c0_g1_i1.p1 TRINITY_DN43002_c0_g1~~TRINITY_DN43002_c0_g1_i1.p1  ORF type:complete len:406 (+),score=116.29 TRINITY_DN43002_c0_g1_i1:64-1281(+)
MAAVPAAVGGASFAPSFHSGSQWTHKPAGFVAVTDSQAATRAKPLLAPLVTRRKLNGVESNKLTSHYTFLLNPGTRYEPGDSLGVLPLQSGDLVSRTLSALGVDGSSLKTHRRVEKGAPLPVRELLTQHLDVRNVSPALARLSNDPDLKERQADKKAFNAYLQSLELHDFVTRHMQGVDRDTIIAALKPLQPRLYSISSCQAKAGNTVDLTVAKVDYSTHGVQRHGTATHYLHHTPLGVAMTPVFVQKAPKFRPPSSETPCIMIGPGTGIAPFRAFLQDSRRSATSARNWLFFGDHGPADYLYKNEFAELQDTGNLRMSLAWSREADKPKVYVQDRIREQGADVWNWIGREKASIFICGDAKSMAPGVEKALISVFQDHGKMDPAAAKAFLKSLEKEGRFHKDVY